jgi:hypothetical protein
MPKPRFGMTTGDSVTDATSIARGLVGAVLRLLMRFLTFVIVGPVIGGFAFIVVGALLAGQNGGDVLLGGIATIVLWPMFLVGCYLAGWRSAALAGLVVAFIGPWIGSRLVLVAVSAIIGGVVAGLLDPADFAGKDAPSLVLGLAGAIAAAGCAWFLDRIDMMRPPRA